MTAADRFGLGHGGGDATAVVVGGRKGGEGGFYGHDFFVDMVLYHINYALIF